MSGIKILRGECAYNELVIIIITVRHLILWTSIPLGIYIIVITISQAFWISLVFYPQVFFALFRIHF